MHPDGKAAAARLLKRVSVGAAVFVPRRLPLVMQVQVKGLCTNLPSKLNHTTCLTFARGLQLLFLPTAPSQFQTPAAPLQPPPRSAAAPFPACVRLLFAKQSLRQRQAHNTGDDLSVSGIACLKCTPADARFGAWTVAMTLSNPQRSNPSARAAVAASLA
jgi:hypothetical protein